MTWLVRATAIAVCAIGLALAPGAAAQNGGPATESGELRAAPSDAPSPPSPSPSSSSARDDDSDLDGDAARGAAPAPGLGGMLGLGGNGLMRSGLLGTLLLAGLYYFVFMRDRGGRGGGGGWGSYYLFWLVVPALIAVVSAHPAVLLAVVVGLVARRWLPDPYLVLKYQARVRRLQAEIDANPENALARRDLAVIWLEKRRPQRALPLLERALARDPESTEITFLLGVARGASGRHEDAVASLVAVVHRDPRFRYGEPYLRAADALLALARWDDAEDALDRTIKINSSSIEARYKLARARKGRGDAAGARAAVRDLRDAWRTLPSYQRRQQLGWYLRALVA